MKHNILVIVESPTKAKTIGRFLGEGYVVEASMGHVRDLPKSKFGIDVEHNFEPTYLIPAKAKKVVADLKAKAKAADEIILATDEDREGEAIAWHLLQALDLDKLKPKSSNLKPIQRIAFHEITKSAIEDALKNPRVIDMRLVDAQQARRVLDRLVGYELSPFLWRKIRYGLSAGRVQSVAVRLVVEREREIEKFVKDEYWTIEAQLANKEGQFTATLHKINGEIIPKLGIKTGEEAKKILHELEGAEYQVSNITKKEISRSPAAPFTTSTLQQECARKLGFSAKQTMTLAQRLYETGAITYMRTDSVNLAESAIAQGVEVITAKFGKEYANPRRYQTKSKGAQEAHEAIRPTDLSRNPEEQSFGDLGETRLYELIWKRTIASQMAPAKIDQTSIDVETTGTLHVTRYTFRATGSVILFDGFIRAYTEGKDEEENNDDDGKTLPPLKENESLACKEIKPLQHFTEPPPRYTDATLVKALEAHEVGRPSTYAPTLSTIQDRGYVEKLEKKYHPTEIGILVNDMLVEHFPEIVDINFTSHIESELDDVAEGKIDWREVCREFYDPFKKHLIEKESSVEKQVQISETPCPHCGKMMLMKFGRMGKFLACPDPESKVTLPLPEEAAQIKALEEQTKDEKCPLCGKPMAVKRGRFGYFLGCSNYPKCKGIKKIVNKIGFKCPQCKEGDLIEKKWRGRSFYGCSRYPDCTFSMSKKPENDADLATGLEAWKIREANPKRKKFKKASAV